MPFFIYLFHLYHLGILLLPYLNVSRLVHVSFSVIPLCITNSFIVSVVFYPSLSSISYRNSFITFFKVFWLVSVLFSVISMCITYSFLMTLVYPPSSSTPISFTSFRFVLLYNPGSYLHDHQS